MRDHKGRENRIRFRVALTIALVLLVVDHGLGAQWPLLPRGQPAQIKSQVKYDPKLSDPFFETEEWTTGKWVNKLLISATLKC